LICAELLLGCLRLLLSCPQLLVASCDANQQLLQLWPPRL
jgi:hypothetical protein